METITDADYADDLWLIANTPAEAESLLHGQKQVVKGIGLYINSNKTEFVCFKQDCAISSFHGKLLKSVDQFTYLNSNISSTESNLNISKSGAKISRLSAIWKSMGILPNSSHTSTTVW